MNKNYDEFKKVVQGLIKGGKYKDRQFDNVYYENKGKWSYLYRKLISMKYMYLYRKYLLKYVQIYFLIVFLVYLYYSYKYIH